MALQELSSGGTRRRCARNIQECAPKRPRVGRNVQEWPPVGAVSLADLRKRSQGCLVASTLGALTPLLELSPRTLGAFAPLLELSPRTLGAFAPLLEVLRPLLDLSRRSRSFSLLRLERPERPDSLTTVTRQDTANRVKGPCALVPTKGPVEQGRSRGPTPGAQAARRAACDGPFSLVGEPRLATLRGDKAAKQLEPLATSYTLAGTCACRA